MPAGFYKLDNKVLKFKIPKDIDKILFNHYIMARENIERKNGILPRGQLKLTVNSVSEDLGISTTKAQRLIKGFIKSGIITPIYIANKWEKKPSIYQYNVIANKPSNTNGDNQSDNRFDNQKNSDTNGLKGVADNQNDNQSDNSKKENIKNKNKKTLREIPVGQIENILNAYPSKEGRSVALRLIPKLIQKHGYEQILNTVKRYSEETRYINEKYVKHASTFFRGAYEDYLDESYESIQQSSRNSHMYEEL